jgi:hypothetical protein
MLSARNRHVMSSHSLQSQSRSPLQLRGADFGPDCSAAALQKAGEIRPSPRLPTRPSSSATRHSKSDSSGPKVCVTSSGSSIKFDQIRSSHSLHQIEFPSDATPHVSRIGQMRIADQS